MATCSPGPTRPLNNSATSATPPFSVNLLIDGNECHRESVTLDQVHAILPALYRGENGHLAATRQDVSACIKQELNLDRLCIIHDYLWLAGLPLPPRALHHQLLLGRQIFITERMDLHLVWTTGKIFLKPVPRFLLVPGFWSKYLGCQDGCGCSLHVVHDYGAQTLCERQILRRRALGFLYSYAALLSSENDFRIAQQHHLLPLEVRWGSWRTFVEELDVEHLPLHIDRRFIHGELRLTRLNKVYYFHQTPMRGYLPSFDRYSAFFQYYFAILASAIAYIAIVLTAMQVGLATDALSHNRMFQSASYGFTVFSIVGPLVVAALIFVYFCGLFVFNGLKAVRRNRQRFSRTSNS